MCAARLRSSRPVFLVAFLLLSVCCAQAQEPPSLRAPPPAQPDVLTAGPNAGAAAQETRDIAGRWLGASDAAIQEFGKAGGSLTNIVTGKFAGLSRAIAIADWSATLGAAWGGDVRGAVSSAVAIKVGATVTSGGATLFGEIGAVAGGAVGSFFPVVGNFAGVMVGGAVGTAAGGFIAAFGYDKYVKDYVAKGVLAGIAAVIDPLPMAEMRAKMDALTLQAMSPEERALLEASATFGGGEVQLIDFGAQPSTPTLKQPAPDAQQQTALGDSVPASFELNQNNQINYPLACTVKDASVICSGQHRQGVDAILRISLTGTVSGNTLDVETLTVYEAASGCTSRAEYRGRDRFVLEKGGRALLSGFYAATQRLRGSPCPTGPTSWSNAYSDVVGTWRPN